MKNLFSYKLRVLTLLFIVLQVRMFISAQESALSYEFNTNNKSEGWSIHHYGYGATAQVSGGSFNVSYNLSQETYNRANLIINDLTVYPASYPILAIKWINAPVHTFQLHCNLGTYKNDATGANHDGVLADNVYYYDLRNSFGSSENNLSLTEPTILNYLQWKVTENIIEGTAGYSIEWIKTFTSIEALEEALLAMDVDDQNLDADYSILSGENEITITGNGKNSSATIYNMAGKVVGSAITIDDRMTFKCKPGIYILKVAGISVTTKKVIVY
ncbi:DUF4979 domain-containing protein [Saccharicrinis sp. 156]|uniref:DUF4979 domain-containing protein n=1 Tax=Saccharicrinis sp. 156 TaxID=3417574 RepID=UPI003D3259CA